MIRTFILSLFLMLWQMKKSSKTVCENSVRLERSCHGESFTVFQVYPYTGEALRQSSMLWKHKQTKQERLCHCPLAQERLCHCPPGPGAALPFSLEEELFLRSIELPRATAGGCCSSVTRPSARPHCWNKGTKICSPLII